ncbi:phosphate ABC transporter ATP-binding protein [Craterilacuibacter sp.]|uniref:phosphate ABC transporter ATP-binding protein n=1 Tax=Craterilacuibacter sp. TaxID=2870909 RepID=UPI003F2B6B4A
MNAIRCRALGLTLGVHALLHDITLDIPARAITVLQGPSGSGKTSFLRMLNLLHGPDARVSGSLSLLLGGQQIQPYHDRTDAVWLRRRVGMVFQHPDLLPGSIARNIALPLQLVHKLGGRVLDARVEMALQQAGLWGEVGGRLTHNAASLSGGQQQRLCLARALALQPEILLLDEPTASLDCVASQTIEERLRVLKAGITIVMVTHQPEQAARLADNTLFFRDGRLHDAG